MLLSGTVDGTLSILHAGMAEPMTTNPDRAAHSCPSGSHQAAGKPSSIVVMGPSGCGKSTLAKALAQALGWEFIEGDEHHPPANLAKMRSGEPLDERDRLPFLASVGHELASSAPAVASCSALRSSHRDLLRSFVGDILFVWPKTDREELARRTQGREGHFMPPALLQSQLATLEEPAAGESSLTLDGSLSVAEQVRTVVQHLGAGGED